MKKTMSSDHYSTNLISQIVFVNMMKLVETSSTHNVINKSSANLIHLSSTVNDPNESSNHNDNYEIPSTTLQLSLESDCRDNNDYTSISYTNGNTSNINSLNKCPIDEQINDYRIHCRNKYIIDVDLNSTNNKSIGTEQNQVPHKWPANTLLIAADSIMSNLDEKKLSRHMNVKVRSFPGSSIADMYSYLQPLLIKEPKYLLTCVS